MDDERAREKEKKKIILILLYIYSFNREKEAKSLAQRRTFANQYISAPCPLFPLFPQKEMHFGFQCYEITYERKRE